MGRWRRVRFLDDRRKYSNSKSFITKPEDKSKNERILPNKAQEGIRPKLKQTKNAEITESPLEKLRRLENGRSMGMLDNDCVLAIWISMKIDKKSLNTNILIKIE